MGRASRQKSRGPFVFKEGDCSREPYYAPNPLRGGSSEGRPRRAGENVGMWEGGVEARSLSVGDLGDVAPAVAAPTRVGVETRSRALTRGCLELVEAVEEGSESAEIATIEGDA